MNLCKKTALMLGALATMTAGIAAAQTPLTYDVKGASVTLYGDVDQYLNFMHSSSGKNLTALEDGAYLRTRLGLHGEKNVGDGYTAKFALEQGLYSTSGAQADSSRLFDRQAWFGIATPVGEFRAGRQNSVLLVRGGYIDNTSRTLGSVINAFGVPSRYDSDLAYISPRMEGFLFEAHYSLQGSAVGSTTNQGVYQLALDYQNGPYQVGYAGLGGKPPAGSLYTKNVTYDNLFADYNYGRGKVYLAYVRSNNNSTTGSGTGLLYNGGSPLGNVGALMSGTDLGVYTTYDIPQISADYQVTQKLRVGGLYGRIEDKSGTGKNATGWNLAAYYDVLKDTMVYFEVNSLANSANAGFRPSGSAGLSKTFTAAADVNGQTIRGVQAGFVYKF